MDEGLSKAVVKVFVELHREGLIYKDKRLVNWDPQLQTAISDLEVEQVEVKGKLWHFKYPIDGEPDRFIVVATTRPETMLGDTASRFTPTTSATRTWSASSPSCRWSGGRSRSSPIPTPTRRPGRARSRSRRRTTSTISRSASATTCR